MSDYVGLIDSYYHLIDLLDLLIKSVGTSQNAVELILTDVKYVRS